MRTSLSAWTAVSALALCAGACASPGEPAAPASGPGLVIDVAHPGASISPHFYGLMTEEINHSYDGGLYAELVRNRNFMDDRAVPAQWSAVHDGASAVAIALDRSVPLNDALPVSLRIDVSRASDEHPAGVANGGYWGIPIRAGAIYRASFFAKAAPGFEGSLRVALESADGGTVYAAAKAGAVGPEWARYAVRLQPLRSGAGLDNRLVVTSDRPGTLWLQVVSLFPPTFHDRPNGNRRDLMGLLAGLHPGFLRFPGGNYLEGRTIAERFDWKRTIGPISERPGHESPWGYRSTDGMGLLEFLEWCEDLKMEPVLAVYAGYSLNHTVVPAGPGLEPYVQDALDEIEYVCGGRHTPWGARRAQDGHPKPFRLRYVEIGNEDWFDRTGGYDARFAQFYDAIKRRHPGLELIATAPVKSRRPDVLDEHFYKRAVQFYALAHRYDGYDRNGPKIFVGEWATREGTPKATAAQMAAEPPRHRSREIAPTPNLNAALGDFAWMTGLERNADVVIMNSYAPLFANVNPGAKQWAINLIGYDAESAYGSPAYYAQQMFNLNRGERVLPVALQGAVPMGPAPADGRNGSRADATLAPRFFCSASGGADAAGVRHVYLKAVNATGSPIRVTIRLAGADAVPGGRQIVLTSASPDDTNTISDPCRVVPVASPLNAGGSTFGHVFPPWSDNVLIIPVRQR